MIRDAYEEGNILVGPVEPFKGATRTYHAQELWHNLETDMMLPDDFPRHFLGLRII